MDKFFHLILFMTTCIQRIDSIPLCYQCMTLVQNIRPFHQPKLNPIKNMSRSPSGIIVCFRNRGFFDINKPPPRFFFPYHTQLNILLFQKLLHRLQPRKSVFCHLLTGKFPSAAQLPDFVLAK